MTDRSCGCGGEQKSDHSAGRRRKFASPELLLSPHLRFLATVSMRSRCQVVPSNAARQSKPSLEGSKTPVKSMSTAWLELLGS